MLDGLTEILDVSEPSELAEAGLAHLGKFSGSGQASLYFLDSTKGLALTAQVGQRPLSQEMAFPEENPASLMIHAANRGETLFLPNVDGYRGEMGLQPPAFTGEELGPSCMIIPMITRDKRGGNDE